jgi:hypothetical protein
MTRINLRHPRLRFGVIAEAADQMVINHSNGLHEGVTNRRADKLETATLQILAQHVGLRR